MAFDAGAIKGNLELDLGGEHGFTTSMLTAEGIARLFPDVVTEFLANPLLGLMDVAKETGEFFIDTFKEIKDDAENVNLESIKLGVSPEFFSQWSHLAETVQVDSESMSNAMRFMERNASEALEASAHGSNEQMKAFQMLGISADELKSHLGDVQGLFLLMKERYDALSFASDRANVAQELLSRGGADLIPLLRMSADHVAELTKEMEKFGVVVDQKEADAGQKFQDLETRAGWAWDGIKRKVEMPIFDFLAKHTDVAMNFVDGKATWLMGEIDKLWATAESPEFIAWLKELGKEAEGDFNVVADASKKAWAELTSDEAKQALQSFEAFGSELLKDLPDIASAALRVADAIAKIIDEIAKLTDNDLQWLNDKDGAGSNMVATALGHPLQRVAPAPQRRQAVPNVNAPIPTDAVEIQKEMDELDKAARSKRHGPLSAEEEHRYNELQKALLHSLATGGGASAAGRSASGVSINNLNVTIPPEASAYEIGSKIKDRIRQAQDQANSQASAGGGG
jgi:hypothetical protein